jgi:hypothetical protein
VREIYFLFAEDGEMKDYFKGVSISSDDDEFSDTTVKSLGGFIGTLLDLLQGSTL